MFMFYLSAIVAVTGAVGYQYFVKRIPETLNQIFPIMGMYIVVLVLGAAMLLFLAEGGIRNQIRQLSWIQIALAISVIMVELGFLLMYRYGWSLGTGNLVTGVFVNVILVHDSHGLIRGRPLYSSGIHVGRKAFQRWCFCHYRESRQGYRLERREYEGGESFVLAVQVRLFT